MFTASANTRTPAVRVFSPTDELPAALHDMDRETLNATITAARRLITLHQDIARNGNPEAERYYFFIPEVAADLANARYTLAVCFAEITRRAPESKGVLA